MLPALYPSSHARRRFVQLLSGNRDTFGDRCYDDAHRDDAHDLGSHAPQLSPVSPWLWAGGGALLLRMEEAAALAYAGPAGGECGWFGPVERVRWWRRITVDSSTCHFDDHPNRYLRFVTAHHNVDTHTELTQRQHRNGSRPSRDRPRPAPANDRLKEQSEAIRRTARKFYVCPTYRESWHGSSLLPRVAKPKPQGFRPLRRFRL